MKKISIIDALISLCPDAEYEVYGLSYSGIVWHDETIPQPSEKEVMNEFKRLVSEAEERAYQEYRKVAYPSIGDQLDALYHAGVFPENMAAQIKEVKDQFPKPE